MKGPRKKDSEKRAGTTVIITTQKGKKKRMSGKRKWKRGLKNQSLAFNMGKEGGGFNKVFF